MKIVIVGRGNLARAIARRCVKENVSYSYWEKRNITKRSAVLYSGSERLFEEVFTFCSATRTPLILLSTSIKYPKKVKFPFLVVPNSSMEVQEFIRSITEFAAHTVYTKVSILESHQKTKKDISGTAKLIAKNLGKSTRIITSIRDPKKQSKLGIPKKYLNGHAYHEVIFAHDGVLTRFSVLVLGRETYAKGALDIARRVIKNKSEKRWAR